MSPLLKQGRTACFTVDLYSRHSAYTVIHLPKECILSSDSSIPVEATMFKDQENGNPVAVHGTANKELLVAAEIVIKESIDPFDETTGVHVEHSGDHLAIVARLHSLAQYRRICEQIAHAVYDDVSAVDVRCSLPSELFRQERREYVFRQIRF